MKTQRQLLSAAWLAVCALLLLSACRGPTPMASRVAEITATRGAWGCARAVSCVWWTRHSIKAGC